MLHYNVTMHSDVKVPMRDGVKLSADVYMPTASGTFPTILVRTPYSNNLPELIDKARRLANNGYVCVLQDVRGRWDSDGDYYPFIYEAEDGFDTQEWIGRQSWSNGKIGMAGGSYLGCVQWLSAPLRSQYVKCLAPRVMCNDYFNDLVYPGGAFQLNVAITWGMRTRARTAQSIDFNDWTDVFHLLPLIDMAREVGDDVPFWRDWIDHPTDDDYWGRINVERNFHEIAVPVLEMSGWYDLYAHTAFKNWNGVRERGRGPECRHSKLIVGPWPHRLSTSPRTGDVDFGANSMVDLEALELCWFDRWLKGIPLTPFPSPPGGEGEGVRGNEPPIRLFIMGINEWREEHEWPLARTRWQEWFLHSKGKANTAIGDGTLSTEAAADEPPDHYVYDPRFPVQTLGGNNCCSPHIVPWGPHDQRPAEMRSDVLCFTTPPLEADLEVTGPIKLILYAASDAPDTDWTAKLVDVAPTGYAMNLCDGIIRARYRDSRTHPTFIEPGNVYEYTIEVGVTGNVFRKGQRIRLEVSSSNFPRFDRNLNTAEPFGKSAEMRAARQTVHHSRQHPSRLVLPVVPTS